MIILVLWFMMNDICTSIGTNNVIPIYNCTCVPYFQCSDDTGEIITDGNGLLDFRDFDNGPCTGYFDVCCNVTKDTFTTTAEEEENERPAGCGYHNPGIFPWSGALFHYINNNTVQVYKCGFSLIHRKVGITAAHCVQESGNFSVRIGNMLRTVQKILIHPGHNSATLQNDLAMLIFNRPVHLSDKIGTICIPPAGARTLWDNADCVATASSSKTSRFDFEPIFKAIKMPIVSKGRCLNALRKTRLGAYFQLHRSFICAGGEAEKDTCGGDGGSPLVCPVPGQPGRYHQAGIVSWGIGCGDGETPGVYVNVGIFRDWIDQQMIDNKLDVTSYRY